MLADKHGSVVHLGERDCSLQRRHQKLWEETPAAIPERVRAALREAGVRAAQAIGYDSAGTIECLVAGDQFYFLEMNTRIQVEHTVTEAVTGLDLIREQIRIAAGEPLGYAQGRIDFRGHAIEARINAEDPAAGFAPAPGRITAYREPAGLGVRVDSAAYAGWTIPAEYDSLIAKLIVWAPSRDEAIARLKRSVDEYRHRRRSNDAANSSRALRSGRGARRQLWNGDVGNFCARIFAAGRAEAAASPEAPATRRRAIRVEVEITAAVAPRACAARMGAPAVGAIRLGRRRLADARHHRRNWRDAEGRRSSEGQVVAVIEAMKMMNEIRAHRGAAS